MSKEGQLLVREHVNAPPDAGSNTTRQQSLSTPSMPVQTETEEHVRGKKALKKHLQRSIDKLLAAKEQLPEEEGREVSQGITDRIKALQLQKDGLMSVAARKKKAFAQPEDSEKTLESKRKALQQAQEALEEASRKHAAAQEACASVEHEIEEEEDQDEEMHEEDQNNTRDPYRDWYNSSDCTSQSRELKEMRTAISQISDTLALLLKTLPPVAVEVGTKEMVGEAGAPMNSKLSVGQLRNRVSSCVHLPMLFQLSPGAVSDMWCGALTTDDDTVSCIEIFTDGSSLIPKAWPRVAASGGWGVLVSAICDNQRIAVIGMFFGEVTVDSGHPFFLWCEQCSDWCVRNSSNLGGLRLVSRCQVGGQECHHQTRQYVCHWSSGQESPLHFTRAIGTSYEALSGKCKKQVACQLQTHQGTSRAVAK